MTEFRTATEEDLAEILSWAAEEGWNPGLEDAAAFYQADPEGFFIARHEGHPVAAISVVNHSPDYAFLGLYIVRPIHRGKGIGLALWTHALAHAGDRTVGLDGVEDQQANYAASGFVHAGGTSRYSGTLPAQASAAIRPASSGDLPSLIAREGAASGVAKPAYLRAWFLPAETRQTFVFEKGGQIAGLCTVRRCGEGAKIGPLQADSPEIAEALLTHASDWAGCALIIDVPQSAAALTAICEGHGMTPSFRTARMYRGAFASPEAPLFAVTSLELG
ncbi:GNAT family N-acetyltransferase [Dinoroseobacter sp. S375]|uniref:GNAT family N-acetyltransferase n=1 Tax=Dinoroseobacter sp. S375 TaxID=3415136 RepID=UPI003C7CF656